MSTYGQRGAPGSQDHKCRRLCWVAPPGNPDSKVINHSLYSKRVYVNTGGTSISKPPIVNVLPRSSAVANALLPIPPIHMRAIEVRWSADRPFMRHFYTCISGLEPPHLLLPRHDAWWRSETMRNCVGCVAKVDRIQRDRCTTSGTWHKGI